MTVKKFNDLLKEFFNYMKEFFYENFFGNKHTLKKTELNYSLFHRNTIEISRSSIFHLTCLHEVENEKLFPEH